VIRIRRVVKVLVDNPIAVLALVVASYGAVLATRTELRNAGRDRKALALRYQLGMPQVRSGGPVGGFCVARYRVTLSVSNPGVRPTTVVALYFRTKYDNLVLATHQDSRHHRTGSIGPTYSGPKLPRRLEDGQQIDLEVDLVRADRAVRRVLRKPIIAAQVQDNSGAVAGIPLAMNVGFFDRGAPERRLPPCKA
jgi:hypothetical protein